MWTCIKVFVTQNICGSFTKVKTYMCTRKDLTQ